MMVCFKVMLYMLYFLAQIVSATTDWNSDAESKIEEAINIYYNYGRAKNIILFIGDGMGMSTITASRIFKGQQMGNTGEETVLKFEEFPHVALSKVYGVDSQIPDSAQTATAIMGGVKTNDGVLGYTEDVKAGDCSTEMPYRKVKSILHHFKDDGRSTGVISTARITHATPAAAYAHTASRGWESGVTDPGNCEDIAYQLVKNHYDIQVVMGGGRTNFLPNTTVDPEYGEKGRRVDNLNLIEAWKQKHTDLGNSHEYVWNKQQFDNINPANTDFVFGLFENSHMQYEVDRTKTSGGEPSISEMTVKAIQILSKNSKGFFLIVEGGRIDHGHHATKAARALVETLAFEEAISKALQMTDTKDTLIIGTADHSHVFTMGGFARRGDDILEKLVAPDYNPTLDGKPYTTLLYGNGPGVNYTVGRPDLTNVDTRSFDYIHQSVVPLRSETHGGEDVPIYAIGPMSHLIHGVQEQNYIAHVMQYASCLGRYTNRCRRRRYRKKNRGNSYRRRSGRY